ncbi:MAG: R3H domain-containing nucleic acid-binding protein, partial [Thermoanaerobaculia bacterium]
EQPQPFLGRRQVQIGSLMMSSKERRFFSADTLEAALLRAASHHQLGAEELAYEVVEKRHGFLRARRGVVIEVDPESPRRRAAQDAPAEVTEQQEEHQEVDVVEGAPIAIEAEQREEHPEELQEQEEQEVDEEPGLVSLPEYPRPAIERYPPATGEMAEAAAEALELLLAVAGLELESALLQGEDHLAVELWGRDQEALLEDRGKLLLAIQHLLPRAIRGVAGRSVACRVDSDNFHEIRQERLRDLAQQAAAEVRRRGEPRTLEPMAPDERRIVHLTLADDPAVMTESQGNGFYKRVSIRPSRQRPRGFDRYS